MCTLISKHTKASVRVSFVDRKLLAQYITTDVKSPDIKTKTGCLCVFRCCHCFRMSQREKLILVE